MKRVKINVSKIDRSAIYEGKNGKYLDLVLWDNKDGVDQYGNDGFVTQDIGKERRLAGEKGEILGNWKDVDRDKPQQTQQATSRVVPFEDDSSIPF